METQVNTDTLESEEFDPDQHDWYSIRIHGTVEDDIETHFQQFCEDQDITRYLLCYEEKAARPHYHSMIECTLKKKKKICNKYHNHFKRHFQHLEGNGSFAWTACYGPQRMFQYICKDAQFRTRSIHFTDDILQAFHDNYWKEQAEASRAAQITKQASKKDKKAHEEKFVEKIRNIEYTDPQQFSLIFRDFSLENNFLTISKPMIDKYYALFLKTLDPEAYKKLILYKIQQITEQYNI